MPIRVVQRSSKRLSKQYYRYGQFIASKTYLLLIFSLGFISYFSLPVIKKQLTIPTTHYTALDGQCWQNSPHVNFEESTTLANYVIQQIRISHVDRPVTFELVQQAHKIYNYITANDTLYQICYQHDDQCLVQAPPLFRDEQDWKEKSNYYARPQRYESHPFSIYGNLSFNQQGDYIKSDAIFLSFVLKQQPESCSIWSDMLEQVKQEFHIVDIQHKQEQEPHWYHATVNIPSHILQYKFKLFPYDIPPKVQLLMIAYIVIFYLVSVAFGRSNLVKSGYTLGLAAIFLSIACFTTTWGITDKLSITFNNVPWYLLLLIVNLACLENIFLLANAVLDAGCDMDVKEKISRGLQSVGLPMTATLMAELLILTVGTAMDIVVIKELCLFLKVALVVDYVLEMTFVIAVLSIDIKRLELADLDDRQMSKRLHELANHETDVNQRPPKFCAIHDTADENKSKSCAECKDYKTHRVFNALIVAKAYIPDHQPDVYNLSKQFWSIVNPEKEAVWIEVHSPSLFIYDSNTAHLETYVNKIREHYRKTLLTVRYKPKAPPSLFRLFINSIIEKILIFLLSINIPVLILWLCLIAIITWMTPKWREQWLVPLLIRTFNRSVLAIIGFLLSIHGLYKGYIKSIRSKWEYDDGAIMAQVIFNKEHSYIKGIHVQTLSHQHVADIQSLSVNADGSLVSCGQEGRLVLWDAAKAIWIARLDKVYSRGGSLRALLNPTYRHKQARKRQQPILMPSHRSPRPLCAKVDRGNKWIATAYDDQTIRIWDLAEGILIHEIAIDSYQFQSDNTKPIRNRFHPIPEGSVQQQQRNNDRIVDIQFVAGGAVNNRYHRHSDLKGYQNCILSVHKSGLIREWDVLSGECLQTIETGHTRIVTQIHVVDDDTKGPYRHSGITWIFTASRDGTIKCWERCLRENSTWTLVYTIEQDSPVTSIAADTPVGDMGILVSGTLDGTVKVWSFETGELVCTLSEGKAHTMTKDRIAGSIHHFSNYSDILSDNMMSDTDSVTNYHSIEDKKNHRGAIYQLVVTRYCEVENGSCLCKGNDVVCSGNGFLVASSSVAENKVNAWRLERKGSEGSCTLLPRDYHRKQYKRHKMDEGNSNSESTPKQRLRSPSLPKKIMGRYPSKVSDSTSSSGIVDIEQATDGLQMSFIPVFLGKVDQPASQGLVFCDKVLAGVRRQKTHPMEWEAWFAPLQYIDSAVDRERIKIPVEIFSLDQSKEYDSHRTLTSFLSLFRSRKTTTTEVVVTNHSSPRPGRLFNKADDLVDEDDGEAGENLPFSNIRHIVPLNDCGFACDYGNFIKLVYIDDKQSLTNKKRQKARGLEEKQHQQGQTHEANYGFSLEARCIHCQGNREDCIYCQEDDSSQIGYGRGSKPVINCSSRHNCSKTADCAAATAAIASPPSSSNLSSSLGQWL
ncbi:hypothetical protein G6F60_007708 [Rhizopus arrhizus]|nr:hypothetical protein G6F61_007198 [Rhizopus arrhizus]KAG1399446.1 hypothetical protein G6F60_007708 [Rhizopus arrhizus]